MLPNSSVKPGTVVSKTSAEQNAPDILSFLNGIPRAAILLGKDYRILAANDRYRAAYGFSDQPREHKCHEVSHHNAVPCDLAGEACPLKDSLETGENTRVLHIHHTPRGEEYVNVEMWPLRNDAGDIEFFIEQMHPSDAGSTTTDSSRMVGQSPAFQAMLNLIERVAPSDANVMLLGESGTGKEMASQTIHRMSPRSEQPFVPVECTGLPAALFESELFGYVKGAFTGAHSEKIGLVAAAEGGTLFLDEVGDIPLADQVKLLRLLETRRYRQVGSTEWQEADFRLICATNKNLHAMVAEGSFREDLFYRLNVFDIELPPLRERSQDLEALIATILERLGATDVTFEQTALDALKAYDFPGNIRELRNIVERSVLLADEGRVRESHLPSQCRSANNVPARRRGLDDLEDVIPLNELEQRYLSQVIANHQGNRKDLAEKLGVSERVLYRKIAALRAPARR